MFFSDQVGHCAWPNLVTSLDSTGKQAMHGHSTWPMEHRGAIGVAALLATLCIVSLASCNDSESADATLPLSRGLVADAVTQQVTASAHSNGGRDTGDDSPEAGTYVPGRLLLKFRAGTSKADQDRVLSHAVGTRVTGEIPHIGVKIVELPPNANERAQARAFGSQAQVEFAELDGVMQPAMIPNDTYYSSEWHLPKIGCPQAWDTTIGSSDVIIAILDTGCDPTHPDLAPKFVPGWNFYDNNSDTHDISGHGTGVTGVAAACGNNGACVASPAWGCRIMPIRICDLGGNGSFSAAANGLIWAADHGARVADVSYSFSDVPTVTSAAQYMQTHGGSVTMPAGNSGFFDSAPDNPYVLTVSATDSADRLATWSSVGNNIDLGAPGVNIYLTVVGGGYGVGTGTCFSAPLVAGVAALMISVNQSLSGVQIQDILKQSADDLGPPGWDPQYGWGRLNAARAIAMAVAAGGPTPDTTPPTVGITSPSSGAAIFGTAAVQVSATDNVGVASVSLYVDGVLFATTTASPYVFAWNTTSLANATHTLSAQASDAAGNMGSATISVNVSNVSDLLPPSVAITSPPDGATIGRTVSVSVNASDNVGVTRVELYVDGAIKSTSTVSPFSTSWNTRKAASGAHTLQTKAYDAAENVGLSAAVIVYK